MTNNMLFVASSSTSSSPFPSHPGAIRKTRNPTTCTHEQPSLNITSRMLSSSSSAMASLGNENLNIAVITETNPFEVSKNQLEISLSPPMPASAYKKFHGKKELSIPLVMNEQNHDDVDSFLLSQQEIQQEPRPDAAIVAELNKLSLKERESILHDIHGVAETIQEHPSLLQQSMKEMEEYLTSSSSHSAFLSSSSSSAVRAYQMALAQDPTLQYVSSLRLLFLRAEQYQAIPAARKLQRFLALKLELFGEEKLCQTITLEDLNDDDIECLRNGHFQLLSSRDQAGRAIFVIASKFIRYKSCENELRQIFYVIMSALEEEATQLNGIVMIAFGLPQQPPWHAWRVNQLTSCIPIQVRGWHVVPPQHSSSFFLPFSTATSSNWLGWLSNILEKRARMRIRSHSGTLVEIYYSLMTFGIPTAHFPIQEQQNGEDYEEVLIRDYHWDWIDKRRQLETAGPMYPPVHQAVAAASTTELLTGASALMSTNVGSEDVRTSQSGFITSPYEYQFADTGGNRSNHQQMLLPTSSDVLFGRGRPYQEHSGNLRFSLILDKLRPHYEALSRTAKTAMAQDVVRKLQARGTRFLRHNNANEGGYWDPVEDRVAREKVSQGFRSIRSGKHSWSATAKSEAAATMATAMTSMAEFTFSNSSSTTTVSDMENTTNFFTHFEEDDIWIVLDMDLPTLRSGGTAMLASCTNKTQNVAFHRTKKEKDDEDDPTDDCSNNKRLRQF